MLRHTFNGLTLAIVMHFGKAPPNLILHVVLAYVCLNVFIMICARLFAVAQTLRHLRAMGEDPDVVFRAWAEHAAAVETYRRRCWPAYGWDDNPHYTKDFTSVQIPEA
jgi:hypothetical protein